VTVYGFTGRTAALDALGTAAAAADRQPTAVVISAVWGTPGIGKAPWPSIGPTGCGAGTRTASCTSTAQLRPAWPGHEPDEVLRRFLEALDMRRKAFRSTSTPGR
jgi:hypothetical protein